MKKMMLFTFLIICSACFSQQSTPKEAFLEKWNHSKDYLLAVVEAMPEAFFSFKPTEREMTFLEQLVHMKGNMDWLSTTYFSEEEFVRSSSPVNYSKEEIKELLRSSFEAAAAKVSLTSDASLSDVIEFFAGPKSKLQILNLLQDHVTHHRGQLIVYLNLKGIEPPKYVGW